MAGPRSTFKPSSTVNGFALGPAAQTSRPFSLLSRMVGSCAVAVPLIYTRELATYRWSPLKEETRSPIKDKPLRLPGQSLEEERTKLFEEKFEMPALWFAMILALTLLEWYRYAADAKPTPILFSLLALGSLCFVVWRFFRVRPKLRALRQGIDGEKVVGQFLERLRAEGYRVFHDVIGDGFNLDHVIIGPVGVLTVETKTWSKPRSGSANVKFDGEKVTCGSLAPDRNPIIQAKAQASWLRGLLQESTGKAFAVRPVIVFPGWFVEQSPASTRDLWVLEPKALPGFLAREPIILSEEQAAMASFHLSRYIRTSEAARER